MKLKTSCFLLPYLYSSASLKFRNIRRYTGVIQTIFVIFECAVMRGSDIVMRGSDTVTLVVFEGYDQNVSDVSVYGVA